MKVIAVANTKGGVGKTTITASLAVRCAEDGHRVALVDLDPQKSLVQWWHRRGETDNPCIMQGVDTASDAVDRLENMGGWDWVFIDGPPAFLTVVQEAIEVSDLAVIPIKPSVLDMLATEDAVVLANEAQADYLVVINDVVGQEKMHESVSAELKKHKIPVAKTLIKHRQSHMQGMTVGKSGAEVNGGKDKNAIAEIDALWKEIEAAAKKAHKVRAA